MPRPPASEPIAPLEEILMTPTGPGRASNVVLLYEDTRTKEWASEVGQRIESLVGRESVRSTWWNIHDLSEPAVLAGAVSTALRADVLVISVHAADGLPLPFYIWVKAWVPHRPRVAGALVALIGLPETLTSRSDHARDFLRAVARHCRLDFLIGERRLPVEDCLTLPDNYLAAV
jgi:hypothetical protein